jgi:site-specific DNA recombinase
MRVRHYPRVSSKEQSNKGDSVEFQQKKLNQDSELRNDIVVGVHTDAGKSASISDDKMKVWHKDGFVHAVIDIRKRKGMNDILDLIKEDSWDALKITKWDRFSRNNIFSLIMFKYFKDNNKKIIAVDDSNDSLVRDFMGALGEKEIDKLKGRIRDVRLMRFEKGLFPARSPYGYRPIKSDKRIIGFKIYQKEAKVVLDCFKSAENGESYLTICKRNNIKPQQYYNIIKNKVYCGYVTFEGKEKKGSHQPIISEELFNKTYGK